MDILHYAKVWYYDFDDKFQCEEVFLIANNYCNAAAKIEESYARSLAAYQIYAFDANMLYVKDLEDNLKEARELFNGASNETN